MRSVDAVDPVRIGSPQERITDDGDERVGRVPDERDVHPAAEAKERDQSLRQAIGVNRGSSCRSVDSDDTPVHRIVRMEGSVCCRRCCPSRRTGPSPGPSPTWRGRWLSLPALPRSRPPPRSAPPPPPARPYTGPTVAYISCSLPRLRVPSSGQQMVLIRLCGEAVNRWNCLDWLRGLRILGSPIGAASAMLSPRLGTSSLRRIANTWWSTPRARQQPFRDRGVSEPFGEEFQYVQLAGSELGLVPAGARPRAARHVNGRVAPAAAARRSPLRPGAPRAAQLSRAGANPPYSASASASAASYGQLGWRPRKRQHVPSPPVS